MADTTSPSVGYKDEFWLHNGTSLYKLRGVTAFDMPEGDVREEIEVTDMDADDWHRQYISGFYEDSEFQVVLNYRPLSDTDVLLRDAKTDGDVRPFKAVISVQGTPTAQIEGTCRCRGYGPGQIAVGEKKEATATFRVVSVDTLVAYVEPA